MGLGVANQNSLPTQLNSARITKYGVTNSFPSVNPVAQGFSPAKKAALKGWRGELSGWGLIQGYSECFDNMNIRVIDNLDGKVETLDYSDAAQVAQLIQRNTKAYNQGEYSEQELERLCAFANPDNIQQEAERGFLAMLLSDTGDLIGCALIMKRGTRPFIRTIQVAHEHARKGYGALLYQHCEDRYRRSGIFEIEVEVTKYASSEAFYRKHGFVKTGNPTQKDLYFAMYKFL